MRARQGVEPALTSAVYYKYDLIIPQGRKNSIYLWGLVMLVCSVLALTFNVIANRMASKVARDTTETLRHDIVLSHIQSLKVL